MAEDETDKNGVEEILHKVDMGENDKKELEAKTEKIMSKIPELDEMLNRVAEGWNTRRMG